MTESPFPSDAVRRLARELADLRSEVATLRAGAGVAQARHSSLDGGVWLVKDDTGTVRQVHGTQPDGTVTTVDLNGPPPPAPAGYTLTPVAGGLKLTYSGEFAGGAPRPSDLLWIEVHVDLDPAFETSGSTLDAILTARGSVTFATDDYVPHTVRMVARNTSRRPSEPSPAVTATPGRVGPGDVAPGGIGTVELDDGAVTPAKSGTGVTSNLVPDPGFNDAGWRAKRAAAPWGFVEATAVGFGSGDWCAFCGPSTTRAELPITGAGGVPVTPGESYFLAYDAGRSASATGVFILEVTFRDSNGAAVDTGELLDPMLNVARAIESLPIAGFATRDGQIVVPPRAATMSVVVVRFDIFGLSSGQLLLDRLEVRSVITKTSSGQRVETSPSGILVFDAAGQAIGSLNAAGALTMLSGVFGDSLTYQGTEVAELLAQRARGEVARVDAGSGSSPATTGEVVWLEFEFDAERGRAYKLRSSGLIARNPGQRGLRVRYTTNGTRPLVSSPLLVTSDVPPYSTFYLASDIGGLADGGDRNIRLAITVRSWNGDRVWFDPADPALGFSAWVEDTGPRQVATGGIVTGGTTAASTGGSDGATTPEPETAPTQSTTTRKTFTTTYVCTWSRSYDVNGLRQNSPMYQGFYPGTARGDQASLFGFDYSRIQSDLNGATISKLEVFLYAEHWYYGAGGTVRLGTASAKSPPANYQTSGFRTLRASWHLNKPEGRWVTLNDGVTIGNEFKNGQTGSFCLDHRNGPQTLNDYGYFSGQGTAIGRVPGLRITYSKVVPV